MLDMLFGEPCGSVDRRIPYDTGRLRTIVMVGGGIL